ncbi:MAG: flagellar biosynthetic protein FliR [Paracoccaceae bacterium]|jgi:flagellar biosynthetic protein FliR
MMEDLAQLTQLSVLQLQTGFVVFLRVGGVMAIAPGFGERTLPARVRLVLTLAFTLVVFPMVAPLMAERMADAGLIGWVMLESLIGLAIGAMLRFFIVSLQLAGTMASQASSLSQLFGGSTGEPQPAIGNLFVLGGLAFAMGMGLHIRFAELIIYSYEALPPGLVPDPALLKDWSLSGISTTFSLAFSLAAPFVIAGLIYNVALGAINRAMPQLMVAFVGAPALTAGGLILLAMIGPAVLQIWHGAFTDFLDAPFEVRP